MTIPYTRWPDALASRYRSKGYWLDRPLSDISDRQQNNDAIAIIDNDSRLSYRQLALYSSRLAAKLQQAGLRKGDTALVQLGNNCEFYLVFFALLKLGVAPVNALYSHQRSELLSYAGQISPALLIADRRHGLFADDQFIQQVPSLKTVVMHHALTGDNCLTDWLTTPGEHFVADPTAADEVAFFQLSGGSTGTPKLIPRTHNDYYYSIRASNDICAVDADTRYLCALPAAHNYPMSSPGCLGVFYAGGFVVMASDPSATQCFPLIEKHQITMTALVPPAVSLWLQSISDQGNARQLRCLKVLQVGGARLSESLARRIISDIGCQLQQVFGMAEGLVNYTRLDDPEEVIVSTQGRPMSEDDEVRVADENGRLLPPGTTGRLLTRGPYTFRGYFNNPAHNATCFDAEGFYCSGDLIEITAEGNIKVQGREKDQINRGGEKIAAEEIENLLQRHPEIIHAALVSMNDELMGEKSCAFIVATQPVKPAHLRRHLREQGIAEFKLPDRIVQQDTLPLTHVGKVDKKALREWLNQQPK
ncbi:MULTISPECIES: (2,3-dihydroxybenzoyl)adenylate synthase [unclassified Tatumella]|uniref:(2,3-dihydroxybenzoyl)adenylate synthase n=1 Tax=unclassified Tatumella TaxID=2649542 RepID=UPI001BAE7E12|nr:MULTISPECIES: (2,3-dihydroxybenzoyl)adenylate synthase [unclassified Tatumella]MBS0877363.1 (2,3-dihydroxybenzoyl)adenylate synthase [Tatumella sp. JGM82]MBS0890764.1 (2,3-dihydroxybenzoyl)adenylate synthase [Tatumella sp. JGM94]MBS0901760.1 (2,3-dihydroxybenzoyl)adenylate synthase [Tatumella sp. JGM100]